MDYFLERIEGRSSEDLTTEVLGYILANRAYAPYQRLFYSLIFPDNELRDSDERQFDVTTQMTYGEFGRPDLIIEGEQEIIFLENKFYASFSLENQMYRYFQYLKHHFEGKEKYLVLLTIRDRTALYLKDMSKQFEADLSAGSSKDLFHYCSENGVKLKTISWEDIFRLFGTTDFLVEDLSNYIRSKYITSTILNEGEIKMINSIDVPVLMEKLWAGIDKVRDMLVGDNYKVLRASQSKTFYGFGVERFWGKIYIEYYHHSWLNHGTPYILQVRSKFIDDKYLNSELEANLKNIGFIYDKEMEYIFPMVIKEADLAGSAIEITKGIIGELDKLFDPAKS